jgi:predicted metal-dependent hydrolase
MSDEGKLLELFGRLAPEQQDKLIAFTEFLTAGTPDGAAATEPLAIPRPAGETVTMAIRRLTRAYPMLDRRRLMGEASRFMAQHALEGRAASEVIDDLEAVFERHFNERHKSKGTRHKE